MFVCLRSRYMRPTTAAARIEVLFGAENPGDQRNIVLDGGPDPPIDSMWPSPDLFGHLFLLDIRY